MAYACGTGEANCVIWFSQHSQYNHCRYGNGGLLEENVLVISVLVKLRWQQLFHMSKQTLRGNDSRTFELQQRVLTMVTVAMSHLIIHIRLVTVAEIGATAVRWSNFVGELVREFPLNYPSWSAIEKSKKAHIKGRLMRWYWKVKPGETRDVETIRAWRLPNMEQSDWDKLNQFRLKHMHAARAAKNAKNMLGTRSSAGRIPLIGCHSRSAYGEPRLQYDKMIRLRDLRPDTPTGRWPKRERHACLDLNIESEISEGSGAGGESEYGRGGDDQPGGDEDADGNDDEGH
nr:hypothetical protein [Tanacetum cinerariifolium]